VLVLEAEDESDVDVGVEELSVLDVEVMVGLGKESDGLAEATLQNCCGSFSAALSSEGHVTEMQETMALGNVLLPFLQKQLTSTTLEQFDPAIALSRQLVTHEGTPLKLGYCAELVDVADTDEFALVDECAVLDKPEPDTGGGTSDADPHAEPAPRRKDTCKTQRERVGEKYFMTVPGGAKEIWRR